IDAPFTGLAPYQADGPLSILERATGRFALGLIGPAWHPVLEDHASDANRIQPASDFFAFQLPVQVPIAASWTYQHSCPSAASLCRPINRDGRFSDVGNHLRWLSDLDLRSVQFR